MQEKLLNLLVAQEIDLEIDRLVNAKKEYPQEMEKLQKEIDDLEKGVENLKNKILENKKSRDLIEDEIAAEKETLEKKEKRLLETKSNKEYTAVQHEIEAAREKIDNFETEDLELMNDLDELTPNLEEMSGKLETTQQENTEKIKEIQTKFDSIESDIAALDSKREEAISAVDGRPLVAYKRLRQSKSGIAISAVDHQKHACTGCFKQLPPQKVMEVRRANKLIFCENCGRILVWDNREDS